MVSLKYCSNAVGNVSYALSGTLTAHSHTLIAHAYRETEFLRAEIQIFSTLPAEVRNHVSDLTSIS